MPLEVRRYRFPLRQGLLLALSILLCPLAAHADDTLNGNGLSIHELPPTLEVASTIDLTISPDSLWERIRNGFGMINLNDDLVLHYQQWYQNRPEGLRRMIERSRPYLRYIVDELEMRGMPTELALLPMVESSFNPMAYSRAHASGLWQFIPATGKRFNLEQNWWRDERRDVVASTNAALDYLQTIYEMHGDWHLALASYNWGEGAVKRAIEKNEARGLPTDYPNLKMPNETRHYVPKLQALKNILGNPLLLSRLGLPDLANEPYFTTYETRRPMDVATAARLANISLEEFQRLNPAHNRPIMKPETSLVLPADKMETFNTNLRQHTAPLTQWQAYTVHAPERADQIASRFGVSTAELIRANSLPGNVRLAAGSKLLVPGGGDGDSLKGLLAVDALPAIVQPEPRALRKGRASQGGSQKKTSAIKPRSATPKAVSAKKTPAKKPAPAKPKKRS